MILETEQQRSAKKKQKKKSDVPKVVCVQERSSTLNVVFVAREEAMFVKPHAPKVESGSYGCIGGGKGGRGRSKKRKINRT